MAECPDVCTEAPVLVLASTGPKGGGSAFGHDFSVFAGIETPRKKSETEPAQELSPRGKQIARRADSKAQLAGLVYGTCTLALFSLASVLLVPAGMHNISDLTRGQMDSTILSSVLIILAFKLAGGLFASGMSTGQLWYYQASIAWLDL